MEQSLIEVLEEEELANLRIQQREFLELRNAELAEQQRLEEQERRHREEKVSRTRHAPLSTHTNSFRLCLRNSDTTSRLSELETNN